MRLSALFIGAAFAAAASARCTSGCTVGTCIRAIAEAPAGGEAFCSSWLSQTPATTVVVEVVTATSTRTTFETASTVLTLTTATVTTVAPTVTVYQRDEDEPATVNVATINPSSSILAQCSGLSSRVSSACSCVLSTTSTVTVRETSTAVVGPEYTTTTTETMTSGMVATETATPTRVIPAQPIVNGDFESSSTTDMSPWLNSIATTGGRVDVISGVNPCTAPNSCAGGHIVIRVYPPTSGAYRFTSVSELFYARPSTTYSLSFLYRCLNFDTGSGIEIYYQGQRIGGGTCPFVNSSAFNKASGISFTTDESGLGEIEVRFLTSSSTPYLYYYADAFLATAV